MRAQNTKGKGGSRPRAHPLQQVPQERRANSTSRFCGLPYFTFKMTGYTCLTDFMGRKKCLEECGHATNRIFTRLRKRTTPALSRQGKAFKVWFTLDLYFIITYFGANYAYTFRGKKWQNLWQIFVKPHFLALLWMLLQLSGILHPAMLHLSYNNLVLH